LPASRWKTCAAWQTVKRRTTCSTRPESCRRADFHCGSNPLAAVVLQDTIRKNGFCVSASITKKAIPFVGLCPIL
jgi:hypothetical protein